MTDIFAKIYDPLYPKHKFYSQGRMKPSIRGLIHLLGSVLIIPALWIYFVYNCKLDQNTLVAFILFTIGCAFCWLVSFTYHFFDHKLSTEIVLQKVDHAFIYFKIFLLWGSLFILTLKGYKLTLAFTIFGLGLIASWISIFIFNYTRPFMLASYVCLIIFFLRDILYEYSNIGLLFLFFILLLVIQFSIFVFKLHIYPIMHYHDAFHLINVISMVLYAFMLFTIIQSDKYCNNA